MKSLGRGATRSMNGRDRFLILQRDGFRCVYCGAGRSADLQVDHIVPNIKGGPHSLDNYVTSCRACNMGKKHYRLSEEVEAKIIQYAKHANDACPEICNRRNRPIRESLISAAGTHTDADSGRLTEMVKQEVEQKTQGYGIKPDSPAAANLRSELARKHAKSLLEQYIVLIAGGRLTAMSIDEISDVRSDIYADARILANAVTAVIADWIEGDERAARCLRRVVSTSANIKSR